jgi:hypothetical protein
MSNSCGAEVVGCAEFFAWNSAGNVGRAKRVGFKTSLDVVGTTLSTMLVSGTLTEATTVGAELTESVVAGVAATVAATVEATVGAAVMATVAEEGAIDAASVERAATVTGAIVTLRVVGTISSETSESDDVSFTDSFEFDCLSSGVEVDALVGDWLDIS